MTRLFGRHSQQRAELIALEPLSAFDEAIRSYLTEIRPSVSLMVEGEWGSGKSHYLRTRGSRIAAAVGKKWIHFSVAGLATRPQLDDSLFLASAPFFKNGYVNAAGVFVRAGLRWLKVEPKELKAAADLAQEKAVVVIDDVERFAGEAEALFGFVIDLVDHHGVHVIIASSEEKISASKAAVDVFGLWKEKIVGKTIRHDVRPEFIVRTVLNEFGDRSAADRVLLFEPLIVQIVSAWGMRNLRAARHALRSVHDVVRAMGERFDGLGDSRSILITGLAVGALEIKRDAARLPLVRKLLSSPDSALAASLAELTLRRGEEPTVEQAFVSEIAERYRDTPLAMFPADAVFSDYLAAGEMDVDRMLMAFRGLSNERSVTERLVSDYFSLPSAVFEAELQALLRNFLSLRVRSIDEIAKTYSALVHFSSSRIIGVEESLLRQCAIDAIVSLSDDEVGVFDRDDDVFWASGTRTQGESLIRAAISARLKSARSSHVASTRIDLLKSFGAGAGDFAMRLKDWRLLPLFGGDAGPVVAAFLRLSPSEIQDVIRFFGSRSNIGGIAEYIGDEKPNLLVAAKVIRPRHEGPFSLLDSQRLRLSDVIFRFTSRL